MQVIEIGVKFIAICSRDCEFIAKESKYWFKSQKFGTIKISPENLFNKKDICSKDKRVSLEDEVILLEKINESDYRYYHAENLVIPKEVVAFTCDGNVVTADGNQLKLAKDISIDDMVKWVNCDEGGRFKGKRLFVYEDNGKVISYTCSAPNKEENSPLFTMEEFERVTEDILQHEIDRIYNVMDLINVIMYHKNKVSDRNMDIVNKMENF